MLLNFIFPSGGHATICGKDVVKESAKIKRFTGYIPSDVRFYEDMTVWELINVSNRFYDHSYQEEAERLSQLFELDDTKKFYELLMGNKKKIAIVCALAARPRVLILDEPTNGLDPMMQKRLFTELKRQSEKGVSILLSSHNLGEVQEYCDRVAFIKNGKILAITDLKEIRHPHKVVTTWGGQAIDHPNIELLDHKDAKRVFRFQGDSTLLLQLLHQANLVDFTVESVLLSVLLKSSKGSVGMVMAVVFGTFIFGILGTVVDEWRFLSYFSPMDWIKTQKLLTEGIAMEEWLVGILVISLCLIASHEKYKRKDLRC